MTNAIAAFGVTLTRAGNTIAEITSIGGIEVSRNTIDVTSHASADSYKEYIPGLKDVGEMNIEGNFYSGDTNGMVALLSDLENGTLQSFVLTFPTAITATWTFSAYVTKFKSGDSPVDGKSPFSASLKISGKPTLAITASAGLTTTFFSMNNSAVITPAPANAVYDYVATVLTAITSVTVTPIAAAGVITVNGNVVATGVASSAIALGAAGSVTVITVVVTETAKVAKTYTIRVSRATS
jgi:predicted secreted protein